MTELFLKFQICQSRPLQFDQSRKIQVIQGHFKSFKVISVHSRSLKYDKGQYSELKT